MPTKQSRIALSSLAIASLEKELEELELYANIEAKKLQLKLIKDAKAKYNASNLIAFKNIKRRTYLGSLFPTALALGLLRLEPPKQFKKRSIAEYTCQKRNYKQYFQRAL